MKPLRNVLTGFAVLILFSTTLLASHSEKALWIEVKEKGNIKTTIAVTEGIAWQLVESKQTKANFSGKGKKDVITKEMLRAVLDGREKSIVVRDSEGGSEVKIYLKDLDIPGKERGKDRLVLETYKSGQKKFSIGLPDIEVEEAGEDSGAGDLVKLSFGWKGLLPFLAKAGGAVYVKDYKGDTEVWVYVE
jgi:hypothetical protein